MNRFLCLLLLLSPSIFAEQFTARVVSVHDADTIVVLHKGRAETIRLRGIDCPETGESKGDRAKKFAAETIGGKNVILEVFGKDKYGRTMAELYLVKGNSFNLQLVRTGNCKWGRSRAMTN